MNKRKARLLVPLLVFLFIGSCSQEPNKEKAEGVTTSIMKTKKILFLGDSIAAGQGLDKSESFPALIQEKINQL